MFVALENPVAVSGGIKGKSCVGGVTPDLDVGVGQEAVHSS